MGWTVVNTVQPPASSGYFDWIVSSFAALAAATAGPLVGVFAGLLLVRGLRREVPCPRCGTANPRQADSCSADLAFMPLEGSRMG
ncbi:MAG: hypothetical protein L0206_09970 [Actinobacteria bacterium]|nr:hypothetical protein [Actinomycetota bacterium]